MKKYHNLIYSLFQILVLMPRVASKRETEGIVRDALEFLRPYASTGAPNMGIIPFDPFVLKYKSISIGNKDISVEGSLSNLSITGVSNFYIQNLKAHRDHTLTLKLFTKSIHVEGSFNITGMFLAKPKLQGTSFFSVDVLQPSASATFRMHRNHHGRWELKHLHVDVDLESARMHIQKLQGAGLTSSRIKEIIKLGRDMDMPFKSITIEELHGVLFNNLNAAFRQYVCTCGFRSIEL